MANLNSTTLAGNITSADTYVPLASLTGINKGDVIFIDLEAMPVSLLLPTANPPAVKVVRTGAGAAHGANALVYTGPPSAFAPRDPVGVPPVGQQNYWINTKTGAIWVAQGDEIGPGTAQRFWQLQVSTPGRGPLGYRITTVVPTQAVQ